MHGSTREMEARLRRQSSGMHVSPFFEVRAAVLRARTRRERLVAQELERREFSNLVVE